MIDKDIFAGFTLRTLPDGERVAVLHLIAPDGVAPSEESVFTAASLAVRVQTLRARGLDTSISEAALAALRTGESTLADVGAIATGGTATCDAASVIGFPGRAGLLWALENAAEATQDRMMHGPCLALLGVPVLKEIAENHGKDAEVAVLLGVADRLSENVRRVDTLAYLGAATFAACLPRVPRAEALAITERLCRAVASAPVDTPSGPVAVTLAVEVLEVSPAEALSPAERAAAILAAADDNLLRGVDATATQGGLHIASEHGGEVLYRLS